MTRKPACWLALAEETGVYEERVRPVRHSLDLLRTCNLPIEKHKATFEHVKREWPKIAPPAPIAQGPEPDGQVARRATCSSPEPSTTNAGSVSTRVGKDGKTYRVAPAKPDRMV
jgi:hypothetical protein